MYKYDRSSCPGLCTCTSAMHHSPAVVQCTHSLWHVVVYVMTVTVTVILGVLSERRYVAMALSRWQLNHAHRC